MSLESSSSHTNDSVPPPIERAPLIREGRVDAISSWLENNHILETLAGEIFLEKVEESPDWNKKSLLIRVQLQNRVERILPQGKHGSTKKKKEQLLGDLLKTTTSEIDANPEALSKNSEYFVSWFDGILSEFDDILSKGYRFCQTRLWLKENGIQKTSAGKNLLKNIKRFPDEWGKHTINLMTVLSKWIDNISTELKLEENQKREILKFGLDEMLKNIEAGCPFSQKEDINDVYKLGFDSIQKMLQEGKFTPPQVLEKTMQNVRTAIKVLLVTLIPTLAPSPLSNSSLDHSSSSSADREVTDVQRRGVSSVETTSQVRLLAPGHNQSDSVPNTEESDTVVTVKEGAQQKNEEEKTRGVSVTASPQSDSVSDTEKLDTAPSRDSIVEEGTQQKDKGEEEVRSVSATDSSQSDSKHDEGNDKSKEETDNKTEDRKTLIERAVKEKGRFGPLAVVRNVAKELHISVTDTAFYNFLKRTGRNLAEMKNLEAREIQCLAGQFFENQIPPSVSVSPTPNTEASVLSPSRDSENQQQEEGEGHEKKDLKDAIAKAVSEKGQKGVFVVILNVAKEHNIHVKKSDLYGFLKKMNKTQHEMRHLSTEEMKCLVEQFFTRYHRDEMSQNTQPNTHSAKIGEQVSARQRFFVKVLERATREGIRVPSAVMVRYAQSHEGALSVDDFFATSQDDTTLVA